MQRKRPQVRNAAGKMVVAPPRAPMTDRKSRLVQYRDEHGKLVTVDLALWRPRKKAP